MTSNILVRSIVLTLTVSALAACTVGPDYHPPETDLPHAWRQAPQEGLAPGTADLRDWWRKFGDAKLDELIGRAISGNYDLQRAVARIAEARARYGVAEGEYWPQVEGQGAYSRFRTSDNVGPGGVTNNRLSIGLNAAWEIDLFGRIARSVEAAAGALDAAAEDYGDVLVSLTAEVAINYIRVRAAQRRVAIAEANAVRQRESLRLARARLSAGLVPELDVAQAETNLADTESTIPDLRAAIKFSTHRIGVLLGEHPQVLHEELGTPASVPSLPSKVTVGVPGDLITHRPDIRRAERALASQTALIGVATADLFPRLSLNGFISLDAESVGDWFESGSRAFSVGPSVRWNLFTGGVVQNRIKTEEARTKQALLAYHQTVLVALEEVENSMVAYVEKRKQRDALLRAVDGASRSSRLAASLYRDGLSDFQNVLDSQRSLLAFQDALAATEGQVAINLIELFRSLGGGWGTDDGAPGESTDLATDEETE